MVYIDLQKMKDKDITHVMMSKMKMFHPALRTQKERDGGDTGRQTRSSRFYPRRDRHAPLTLLLSRLLFSNSSCTWASSAETHVKPHIHQHTHVSWHRKRCKDIQFSQVCTNKPITETQPVPLLHTTQNYNICP